MQPARSNLQVQLISDARKLLEKLRSDDCDDPSFDSSLSSFRSSKVVKKPEPLSPSNMDDIVFVQKSQSQEESDEGSVGSMSFSQGFGKNMNGSPRNSAGSSSTGLADGLPVLNSPSDNDLIIETNSSGSVNAANTLSMVVKHNSVEVKRISPNCERMITALKTKKGPVSSSSSSSSTNSIRMSVKPKRKQFILGSSSAFRAVSPQNVSESESVGVDDTTSTQASNENKVIIEMSGQEEDTKLSTSSVNSIFRSEPSDHASVGKTLTMHEVMKESDRIIKPRDDDILDESREEEGSKSSSSESEDMMNFQGEDYKGYVPRYPINLGSDVNEIHTADDKEDADVKSSVSSSRSNQSSKPQSECDDAIDHHSNCSNEGKGEVESDCVTRDRVENERIQVKQTPVAVDGNKDQIKKLKEQNHLLQEENKWLQEDMNSFDEKLACLEVTLGIIDIVEKNSAEFESQVDSDDEYDEVDHSAETRDPVSTSGYSGDFQKVGTNMSPTSSLQCGSSPQQVSHLTNAISNSSPRSSFSQQTTKDDSHSCGSKNSHKSSKSQKSKGCREGFFSICRPKKSRSALQERLECDEEKSQQSSKSLHKKSSGRGSRSVGSVISNQTAKSNSVPKFESKSPQLDRTLLPSTAALPKEGDKENLDRDNRSYQSSMSSVSTVSQNSTGSYGSARSRSSRNSRKSKSMASLDSGRAPTSMGLASIGEEHPDNRRADERDDEPDKTKARAIVTSSSKVSTPMAKKLSSQEMKELKMLRDNNSKMMIAIKALSKATTIQARKHYHYKRKFGHTAKSLEEGNNKMSQLVEEKAEQESKFYEARSNYLQEQDKREELSFSVQALARKTNVLRKQLVAEEETKMTILNRIDENSISSGISSGSSRPSLVNYHSISMDSLDCILSPVSQNEARSTGSGKPPRHKHEFEEELENMQTRLNLELEIANLKGKLEKKQKKIDRLQNKFSMVKGFLKSKEESIANE